MFTNTPLSAFQIYLSNGRNYAPPSLNIPDLLQAKEILLLQNKYMCIHGCLIYNLCGSVKLEDDPKYSWKLNGTLRGLTAELDIAGVMGVGVVVHVGSCKDKAEGIRRIAKSITHVLKEDGVYTKTIAKKLNISRKTVKSNRRIILENLDGGGNKIGSTLQELADIINLVEEDVRDKITICIDTCHIFIAGQYHFGQIEDVVKFYEDFATIIPPKSGCENGISRLEVFHFNDSARPYGEKKADRHAPLGKGHIFSDAESREALRLFVEYALVNKIPLVGEPPEDWRNDLMLLVEECGEYIFEC